MKDSALGFLVIALNAMNHYSILPPKDIVSPKQKNTPRLPEISRYALERFQEELLENSVSFYNFHKSKKLRQLSKCLYSNQNGLQNFSI